MKIEKPIIGLSENIKIYNTTGKAKLVHARIDTGATISSMDINIAAKLQLGPILKLITVKNSNGKTKRPVIMAEIEIAGKRFTEKFTLADRTDLKFEILIGQNILKHGFLIDPIKK